MQCSEACKGGYQLVDDGISTACSPSRLICLVFGQAVVHIAGVCVVDEGCKRVYDDQACAVRRKGSGRMHEKCQEMSKRWHGQVVEMSTQFISRDMGRIGLRSEHVVDAMLDQRRTGSICKQSISPGPQPFTMPASRSLTTYTYRPIPLAGPRAGQRLQPVSLNPSVAVSLEAVTQAQLPKCCLADSGRAEDLSHLPAYVSARDMVAR